MKHENENNRSEQKMQVVAPALHSAEPLALLMCEEFSLLIPSRDIVTLVSSQKILFSNIAQACGEIEFNQHSVPVFAFTKALQLQPQLPVEQMTLVVLQYESYLFAICCSELKKLNAVDLHFYTVPLSMSSRKQPFTQFAIVNHVAAGLSSTAQLWRLVRLRKAGQAIPLLPTQVLMQGAG